MRNNEFELFTIGFTQKPASAFFETLRTAQVARVIDVRLNNVSQLAAFSKRDDLKYFLKEILHIDYIHEPLLAPTQDMLDRYKKNHGSWDNYQREFLGLMEERRVEEEIDPGLIAGGCLLCSEHQPHHCHRRLVAEYLKAKWNNVEIKHLA
jgi:uncharacterized protein (DUF488 family)